MKRKFLNNYGLKLLAIVCAVLIWGAIVNVNDPSDRIVISNIPVTLTNTDVLTDNDYIYEVVNSSDKVTIEVKGPRSIIENLKAVDFAAMAQVENEFAVSAKIVVKCVNSSIDPDDISVTLKNTEVKLDVQNLVTKTFDVEVDITGQPSNSCYTDKSLTQISPTSIRVSGPENIIEQISTIKAIYDVTGETNSTKTTNVSPVILDANGKIINSAKLNLSRNSVTYTIDILKMKTVPVKYATSGTLSDGYKFTGLSSTVDEVVIAGSEYELSKISSIDVSASYIDLTGLTASKVYTVPIAQYIPGSVIYISDKASANVTASVEKLVTKTFSLANDKITVKNLKSGYKLEYLDKTVNTITVKGIQNDIDNFTVDNLDAEIDLASVTEGNHSVTLKVSTKKQSVEVEGSYKVNIGIVKDVSVENTVKPTDPSEPETEN